MSATPSGGGGRGRGRGEVVLPLRKPGEFREPEETSVSQDDEKPPVESDVQSSDQTVNTGIEKKTEQLVQDMVGAEKKVENSKQIESPNVDNVLLKAVKNPVFVPKTSSRLALAVNAPVFVPGQAFHRCEETPEARLLEIESFVNNKIKQLMENPDLIDEISMSMANYLSVVIKVENDMIKLSDLLFEECISEHNFQYTGSRLANVLDKKLAIKTEEAISFRKTFLKRCSNENKNFTDVIHRNPERAYNFAIFLGELLMNYKTIEGETIHKLLTVVSNIIKQLLGCRDRELLVCAGNLLKLTGSTLNQSDELFETVTQLVNDPDIDSTAQMLFSRVCELRRTNWSQQEIPQTVTFTEQNIHGAWGYSTCLPNMGGIVEEQSPGLPVFVEGFLRYEETPEGRLSEIECFVNNKIKQLIDDPGLLDEISMSMANYLSVVIKVENDMIKLSDLLFEKCISEQNFQYTGSRLANFLDKKLTIKTKEDISFRTVFLKRCSNENKHFTDVIHTNPERACNVAIFLGELLMNYKTIKGETITKFLTVVSSIIHQLLGCRDRKLLICAGKLLKLTGSTLNQSDELFETVTQLANDPVIDRTAQMLFSRVCELRRTSWGQQETPQTVTYTEQNTHGAQGHSMYFPNMGGILEEQSPGLPVFVEEEWNEYATDVGQEEVRQNDNEEMSFEELIRQTYWEQYGEEYVEEYVPYTTEDNWPNLDDYDDDLDKFNQEKPK